MFSYTANGSMSRITHLPVEVLLRIFHFYLESENQNKLWHVLSRVCKMWQAVCLSTVLWKKFDGTVEYKTLKTLYSHGSLDYTKELVVSPIKYLKEKDAEMLFLFMKNLQVVNLSQVEKLSPNVISILAESTVELKEIQFASENLSKNPKVTLSRSNFSKLFTSKGRHLATIKLSNCVVQSSSQALKCLSENCPNLENLNFTNNISNGVFPTRSFQLNCPKLKILHLDQNTRIGAGKYPSGFPNLEFFSYTDMSFISTVNDANIANLLFNSTHLKFLSLINCSVSAEVICSLPASCVEFLFLARSKIVNSSHLPHVFKKWCHSLKQVDISYSTNISVNNALLVLTSLPSDSPVEFLDLSYTRVTSETVKTILEKCRQLEQLCLAACKSLSRGFKKNHTGKQELRILYRRLQEFSYNDSTDEEMY